ncbi:hypothetical protein [Vibrio breoganii]|nr:hypothetical protein [Vibrio breoganii]
MNKIMKAMMIATAGLTMASVASAAKYEAKVPASIITPDHVES